MNFNAKAIKTLFAILLINLSAFTGFAQATQSVNIIFNGISNATKNYKVTIAGKSFYSNKDYNNSDNDQNIVSLDNLTTKKYIVKVYRLGNNNAKYNSTSKKALVYTKSFNLQQGYDMDITVDTRGHIEFNETATEAAAVESDDKAPMTDVKFTALLQSVRGKFSQALKGDTESDAFTNSGNYFTASQVRQLLALIASESDRVDLAKLSYGAIVDSSNFTQLYDLFKSTASRNELNDFLRSKGWNTGNEQAPVKTAMNDVKFNSLLQTIQNKFSQALKGETESDAFTNTANYFTTSQIRQLLTLMTSERDRVDLAKLSYRSVTDSANFAQLYDLFRTQSIKNEFNSFLRSKGWNMPGEPSSVKTPITDAKFTALLQTVQGKWSQALKGETESDAFNNTNNYFRTAQVKQLLALITTESDRLDLAKLSYRSITDSANFAQVYDLFPTPASRDELNNFLRSKGWNNNTTQAIKTPMSDADFDQVLFNVRANLIQYLKINYETDVFSNSGYYFTTSQVKQLLLLINAENSRLELAKLAYKTVTDPTNFLQLNTVFNTQGSRDQLTNFVKTQAR